MSATMQDPEAEEPERDAEAVQHEQQEQRERNLTRLDTILRAYTPRELEVAREALRSADDLGNAALRTFRALREEQGMDLRGAGDLVRAVAQADGVWEQRTYPEDEITEALRTAAQVMAKAGTFTPEEWDEAARCISKAGVSLSDLHGSAFEQPIVQEGVKLRADSPTAATRRVLGRGLAEIGEWTGLNEIAPIHIEGDPISQQRRADEEAKISSASRERDKRDLFAFRYGSQESQALHNILLSGRRQLERDSNKRGALSDLTKVTQRAVDDFLGTGTHRTQALRGFLRFLTQEDLATVLAECCVQIDDEHLQHTVRMLGSGDLQSLSWAAQEEVSARMLTDTTPHTDALPPEAEPAIEPELPLRGFPLRPLEPHEHREPVDWSENGNPLLEKDVELALDIINEAAQRNVSYLSEGDLADVVEKQTGWNSVYAGEVALEAWKRYYREPESHDNDDDDKGASK